MTEESQEFTLFGHARSGNAYKAGLILSMTGTPFVFKNVDLEKGEQRSADFRAINPAGKIPVLKHGRQHIRESNTIMIYVSCLKESYGAVDAAQRVRISEWMFWEQDTMFPGIGRTRFFANSGEADPALVSFFRSTGEKALDRLEEQLSNTEFLTGANPTVADLCIYGYASLAEEAGFETRARPRFAAWRALVESLPGWNSRENLLK